MKAEGESNLNQMEELLRRAERYPVLYKRMLRLLDMVENTDGDVTSADDAEERAIDEVRHLGKELLHTWGQRTADEAAAQIARWGGVVHQTKKTVLAQHLR
jgi:hypothetical protein